MSPVRASFNPAASPSRPALIRRAPAAPTPIAPWNNTADPRSDFHSFHYLRHTFRVMEHLASLGLPLRGRRVLEISGGIGDLTTFFLDRDCTIDVTDVREQNLQMMRERFEGEPRVRVMGLDLEAPTAANLPPGASYEVIFNFGLLYHLSKPRECLEFLAPYCSDLFLLETCVSLGDHEAENLVAEEAHLYSQAASGTGCRPTRPWVFAQLKRLFPHVYMPTTQPNWKNFITDWTIPQATTPLTRAIFIASRTPINNPLLVPSIPMTQARH